MVVLVVIGCIGQFLGGFWAVFGQYWDVLGWYWDFCSHDLNRRNFKRALDVDETSGDIAPTLALEMPWKLEAGSEPRHARWALEVPRHCFMRKRPNSGYSGSGGDLKPVLRRYHYPPLFSVLFSVFFPSCLSCFCLLGVIYTCLSPRSVVPFPIQPRSSHLALVSLRLLSSKIALFSPSGDAADTNCHMVGVHPLRPLFRYSSGLGPPRTKP